ncbi:hypothetical protein DPM13_16285 [Paracoccus mutanolyticus]|uniref:Uncharacterized protein n=1 Tax=Paracoccus mutanolyticus TaxID=1499308 RepID=A0ABM6WTH7_9RHOB|nr:hypothetical protein DPM13_16285 [Paracoccus mutanolyticus]
MQSIRAQARVNRAADTEQCNGDAECAVSVLLLASAIAGMKAGLSVGEMALELMGLVIAAEILPAWIGGSHGTTRSS